MTTETPTPCRPPETAYALPSNLPPACSTVSATSTPGFLSLGCRSTGKPRPLSIDADAAVGEQHHVDGVAVAGQRLVDRVVDDLPDQVVQAALAGRTDVHTGPLADRLEALEHLDRLGTVFLLVLRCHPGHFLAPPGTRARRARVWRATRLSARAGTTIDLRIRPNAPVAADRPRIAIGCRPGARLVAQATLARVVAPHRVLVSRQSYCAEAIRTGTRHPCGRASRPP